MTFVPSLSQLGRHPGAAGYDASTVTWVNAVVAAGGTVSTTRKGLVDTLIKALKSAGIWTKLDRLWLFAAENSTAALVDVVSLQTATVVNSLPFTADQGFGSPSNTTAYLDSGFTPSAGGTNYALNSASVGIRPLTNVLGSKIFGATVNSHNLLRPLTAGNTANALINDNALITVSNTAGLGLFVVNRSASNARQIYLGGSSLGSDATASIALGSGHIAFAADPVASSFSQMIVASAMIGGSLDATGQTNFYNAEHAYMQAIGLGASAP